MILLASIQRGGADTRLVLPAASVMSGLPRPVWVAPRVATLQPGRVHSGVQLSRRPGTSGPRLPRWYRRTRTSNQRPPVRPGLLAKIFDGLPSDVEHLAPVISIERGQPAAATARPRRCTRMPTQTTRSARRNPQKASKSAANRRPPRPRRPVKPAAQSTPRRASKRAKKAK